MARKNSFNTDNLGFNFGIGSIVTCKAEDTSYYCSAVKAMNVMYMFFLFLMVCVFLYYVYKFYWRKK